MYKRRQRTLENEFHTEKTLVLFTRIFTNIRNSMENIRVSFNYS